MTLPPVPGVETRASLASERRPQDGERPMTLADRPGKYGDDVQRKGSKATYLYYTVTWVWRDGSHVSITHAYSGNDRDIPKRRWNLYEYISRADKGAVTVETRPKEQE